jgi:hypothetical protein
MYHKHTAMWGNFDNWFWDLHIHDKWQELELNNFKKKRH